MLKSLDNVCNDKIFSYYANFIRDKEESLYIRLTSTNFLHQSSSEYGEGVEEATPLFNNIEDGGNYRVEDLLELKKVKGFGSRKNVIRLKIINKIVQYLSDKKKNKKLEEEKIVLLLLKYGVNTNLVKYLLKSQKLLNNPAILVYLILLSHGNRVLAERVVDLVHYYNVYRKCDKLYRKFVLINDESKFKLKTQYNFLFSKSFQNLNVYYKINETDIQYLPLLPYLTSNLHVDLVNLMKKVKLTKFYDKLNEFDKFILTSYFNISHKSNSSESSRNKNAGEKRNGCRVKVEGPNEFSYLMYKRRLMVSWINCFDLDFSSIEDSKINFRYKDSIKDVLNYQKYQLLVQQYFDESFQTVEFNVNGSKVGKLDGKDIEIFNELYRLCDVGNIMNVCLKLNLNLEFLRNHKTFSTVLNHLNKQFTEILHKYTNVGKSNSNSKVSDSSFKEDNIIVYYNLLEIINNLLNKSESDLKYNLFTIDGSGCVKNFVDSDRLLFCLLLIVYNNNLLNINILLNILLTTRDSSTILFMPLVPSTSDPQNCYDVDINGWNFLIYYNIFLLIYKNNVSLTYKYYYVYQYYFNKLKRIYRNKCSSVDKSDEVGRNIEEILKKLNLMRRDKKGDINEAEEYYNKKCILLNIVNVINDKGKISDPLEIYSYCYNILLYYLNNLSYNLDSILIMAIYIIIYLFNFYQEIFTNSSLATLTISGEVQNSLKVSGFVSLEVEKLVGNVFRVLNDNIHKKISLYTINKLIDFIKLYEIKVDLTHYNLNLFKKLVFTRNKKLEKNVLGNIDNKSNTNFRYFILFLIYSADSCTFYSEDGAKNMKNNKVRRLDLSDFKGGKDSQDLRIKLYKLLDISLINIPSLLKYIIIYIINDYLLITTQSVQVNDFNFKPIRIVVEKLNDILLHNSTDSVVDYLSLEILYYLLDHIFSFTINYENKSSNRSLSNGAVEERLYKMYKYIISGINKTYLYKCSCNINIYTRTLYYINTYFLNTKYQFNSNPSLENTVDTEDDSYLVEVDKYYTSMLNDLSEGERSEMFDKLLLCYDNLNDSVLCNYVKHLLQNSGNVNESFDLSSWDLQLSSTSDVGELKVGDEAEIEKNIKLLYISIKENNYTNYISNIQSLSTLIAVSTLSKSTTQGVESAVVGRVGDVIKIYEKYKGCDEAKSIDYILRIYNDLSYEFITSNSQSTYNADLFSTKRFSTSVNKDEIVKLCHFIEKNIVPCTNNIVDSDKRGRILLEEYKLYKYYLLNDNINYYNTLLSLHSYACQCFVPNTTSSTAEKDVGNNAWNNIDKSERYRNLLMNYYCNSVDEDEKMLKNVIIINILRLLNGNTNYKLYYLYSNYLYQLIINKLSTSSANTIKLNCSDPQRVTNPASATSSQSEIANPNSFDSEEIVEEDVIGNIEIENILSRYGRNGQTDHSNRGELEGKEEKKIMGITGIVGISNLSDYSNLLLHTINIHFLTLTFHPINTINGVGGNKILHWIMIRLVYILTRFSTEGNIEFERGVILDESVVHYLYRRMFLLFNRTVDKFPVIFYYIVINQLVGLVIHKYITDIATTILSKLLYKYPNVILWYITYFKFSKIFLLNNKYNAIINSSQEDVSDLRKKQIGKIVVKYNILFNELYKLSLQDLNPRPASVTIATAKDALLGEKGKNPYVQNLVKFFDTNSTTESTHQGEQNDRVDEGMVLPNDENLLFNNIYNNVDKEYISNISTSIITLKSKQKPKLITFITSKGGKRRKIEEVDRMEKVSGNTSFILKNELKGDLRKDLRSIDTIKFINILIENIFHYKLPLFNIVIISEVVGLIQFVPNLITIKHLYNYTTNNVHQSHTNNDFREFEANLEKERQQELKKNIILYIKNINNKVYSNTLSIYNNILNIIYNHHFDRNDKLDRYSDRRGKDSDKAVKNVKNKYYNCLINYIINNTVLNNNVDYNKIYEMEKRYIISNSIWNIYGYILGLGDRHTENILINSNYGDVIHVDYDCLFDKGYKLLIPELIPFRLTPIIIYNLGISGINVNGVYYNNSLKFYKLLNNNKEIIKLILYNFLLDPMIKWNNISNKITLKLSNYLNIFTSNSPNRDSKENETVDVIYINERVNEELYIKELIKSSINKHLLSRMFVGWAPWI